MSAELSNDLQERLLRFMAGAQAKVDANCAQYRQYADGTFRVVLEQSDGPRYIRLIKAEYVKDQEKVHGRSVYCFVDKTNGDLIKGAGWKGPVKNGKRGSLLSEDFGLSRFDHHGPCYLR